MIRSTSFDELARSPDILRDLTIAVADYMKKKPREVTMNSRSDSTVNELIGELITLELDIDGTKEILIARLDEYYRNEEETRKWSMELRS